MINIYQTIKAYVRGFKSVILNSHGSNEAHGDLCESNLGEWASQIGLKFSAWNLGNSKDFEGQYRGHSTIVSFVCLGIETSMFVPLTRIRVRLNCTTRNIVKSMPDIGRDTLFSAKAFDVNQSAADFKLKRPSRDFALQFQEIRLRLTTSRPSHLVISDDELIYNIDEWEMQPEILQEILDLLIELAWLIENRSSARNPI